MPSQELHSSTGWWAVGVSAAGLAVGLAVVVMPPYSAGLPVVAGLFAKIGTIYRLWRLKDKWQMAVAKENKTCYAAQDISEKIGWYREQAPFVWVAGFFSCLAGMACAALLMT